MGESQVERPVLAHRTELLSTSKLIENDDVRSRALSASALRRAVVPLRVGRSKSRPPTAKSGDRHLYAGSPTSRVSGHNGSPTSLIPRCLAAGFSGPTDSTWKALGDGSSRTETAIRGVYAVQLRVLNDARRATASYAWQRSAAGWRGRVSPVRCCASVPSGPAGGRHRFEG
jgi:hypothetical protein